MVSIIKKLLIFVLCLPLPLAAQKYSEQSLETLFTSSQQRQDLDGNRADDGSPGQQLMVGPSNVKINGLVRRSNGKSVVWINGKNTIDSSDVDGVIVNTNSIGEGNKISVIVDGERVWVKPGETWSEGSGVSGVGD